MKINYILYLTIIGISFICVKSTPIEPPICSVLLSQLTDLNFALSVQITAILDLFAQLELSNCNDEESGQLVDILIDLILRCNVLFTAIGDIYANLHIDSDILHSLLGSFLGLINSFLVSIGGSLQVITDNTIDPIIQLIIPGVTCDDFAAGGILDGLLNLVTSLVGTVVGTGAGLISSLLGTAGPILNTATSVLGSLTGGLSLGI